MGGGEGSTRTWEELRSSHRGDLFQHRDSIGAPVAAAVSLHIYESVSISFSVMGGRNWLEV